MERLRRTAAVFGRSGAILSLTLAVIILVLVVSTPIDTAPRPLVTSPSSTTGFSFRRAEKCVMKRVNAIRSRHGLNTLKNDRQLGYVARLQAVKIARARSLFHDLTFGDKITGWYSLGQNTGRGRSCRKAVRVFVNDPVHMEIILGPWNYQGVGTRKGKDGRLYVQHLFESQSNPGNIYQVP